LSRSDTQIAEDAAELPMAMPHGTLKSSPCAAPNSRTNAPFAIGLDPSGELARTYSVRSMPTSVLIDGTGRVLAVHSGFKASDAAALERRIEQALDAMPRAEATTR
jgi:hypothetical protein